MFLKWHSTQYCLLLWTAVIGDPRMSLWDSLENGQISLERDREINLLQTSNELKEKWKLFFFKPLQCWGFFCPVLCSQMRCVLSHNSCSVIHLYKKPIWGWDERNKFCKERKMNKTQRSVILGWWSLDSC